MSLLNSWRLALVLGFAAAGAARAQEPPPPPPIDADDPGQPGRFGPGREITEVQAQRLAERMYGFIDQNGDGIITQADAPKPRPTPEERFATLLRDADANRDGKVTHDEYLAFTKKHFAELDKNKDGLLSRDERPAEGWGLRMGGRGARGWRK